MKKYWHLKPSFKNPKENLLPTGFRFASICWVLSRIFVKPYVLGKDLPHNHLLEASKAIEFLDKHAHTNSITWLGHATFLIKVNGINILTDPLLFGNPAPFIVRGLRRLPSPIQADDFNVDVLLLSHEHGDHLHHPTLKSINFKKNIQAVVPLGVGKKIAKHNFKKTIELNWSEEYQINERVLITAVPAVHYSNFSDTNLWSGFIIEFKDENNLTKKIYFGGDTGYGEFLKRDVSPYGPFDLALVGIGSFELPFNSRAPIVHTTPEQAVRIASDINSKKLIGMHWGTIKMADEDPMTLFPRAKKEAQVCGYTGEIIQMAIGETISLESKLN